MRTRDLLTPPKPGEGHDAFMSRCQAAGYPKDGCEVLWQDAQGATPPKGSPTMNAPIPLRADAGALERSERRAWQRSIAASVFACSQRTNAAAILKATWPGDTRAASITKAATSPTTSSMFPAQDVVAAFKSLAPGSAAASLFALSNILSLAGLLTIRIPYVASLPPVQIFIGEGLPAPVQQFTLDSSTLGPTRKMLLMAAVSGELEQAGPEAASLIIGRVLADRANRNLDLTVLGTGAGDAATPPGLLHGVTPLAAAAAGPDAMAEDLAALVAAIGAAGIDPSDAVYGTGPREATLIKTRASLKFNNTILMTLGLPAKSIAAFAPNGVYSGYDGAPQIETGRESVIHFDEDAPLDISAPGSPPTVAAPAKSMFQSDMIAIRVRTNCAWVAAPGAAQVINTVNW